MPTLLIISLSNSGSSDPLYVAPRVTQKGPSAGIDPRGQTVLMNSGYVKPRPTPPRFASLSLPPDFLYIHTGRGVASTRANAYIHNWLKSSILNMRSLLMHLRHADAFISLSCSSIISFLMFSSCFYVCFLLSSSLYLLFP